nr:hypothetical protein Q903MT_gene1 [Picea sitchensis]
MAGRPCHTSIHIISPGISGNHLRGYALNQDIPYSIPSLVLFTPAYNCSIYPINFTGICRIYGL